MKNKTWIGVLVLLIVVFASIATTTGIYSNDGPGKYEYKSVRGQTVSIYGKGLYKDMSAEVAPQGIAQDYVTLFIAVPLLIISFLMALRGSKKGQYLLAGTLGYFLITYLFYTVMGMYNKLFLVYVILMGSSFYAFILILVSINRNKLPSYFKPNTPVKTTGAFLIFNATTIALLWLSIVVPPLLNGSIIPTQVEHYATLIVQALDLGILLPAAVVSGVLWIRKRPLGYLLAPVYFICLSVLMCALTAKVIAMSVLGYNVFPAVYIIPTFNIVTVICSFAIVKNVNELSHAIKNDKYEKVVYARQT